MAPPPSPFHTRTFFQVIGLNENAIVVTRSQTNGLRERRRIYIYSVYISIYICVYVYLDSHVSMCSVLLMVSTEPRPFFPRLSFTLVLAERRVTSFTEDELQPVFAFLFVCFFQKVNSKMRPKIAHFPASLIWLQSTY